MGVSNTQLESLKKVESNPKGTYVGYNNDDTLYLERQGLIMYQQNRYFITSLGRIKLAEIKEKQ